MNRPLWFVLLALLATLTTPICAQSTADPVAPVKKAIVKEEAKRVDLTPDQAIGRKVSEVIFMRYEGKRITNAPPTSVRQYDVARELRLQVGQFVEKGDFAAAAKYMTKEAFYFEEVTTRVFANSDDPLAPVSVEFICREARIAEINIFALTSGWWRQARPETLYIVNSSLTHDVGQRYSIDQMDRDIRERMLNTGHFIDVVEERAYRKDGVHLTLRVVTSQRVDHMLVTGNYSLSNSSLIEAAGIKDAHYAGPDTIGGAKRAIRSKYIEEGYAFVEIAHRVIKIPSNPSAEGIKKVWKRLPMDICEEIVDEARNIDANDLVLALVVDEGPRVQVGEFTFKGIEELVDIPGADTLEPGKLPFNYWPLWYASNPMATRLDRVQRSLYQVMQRSPGVFSPKPNFSFEQAVQDSAFLQDHLRKAGWLDARVTLEGVTYNEDRSRAGLQYRIIPGKLYMIMAVALRVETQPAPTKPDDGPVKRVLTDDEIFEAMRIEGKTAKGMKSATIGEDYRVLTLDKFTSFDDAFFNGDPSDPSKTGALKRVRAAFGEHSYSNIGVQTQPVFLDMSDALSGTDEAKLLGANRVEGVVMVIDIDQGQKYRVGNIVIRGNEDTKTSVIRRHLRIFPGEPFNIDHISRAKRNLRRTQWFDAAAFGGGVNIVPRYRTTRSDEAQDYYDVDIYVDVIEGSTGSINASAGFSPGVGATASLSITKRNFDLFDWPGFTGAGQTISFAIEPKINETERYTATFTEPFLFGYPVSLSVTGRLESQEYTQYTRNERGGKLAFGHEIFRDLDLILAYRFFENEIENVHDNAPFVIRQEEGLVIFAGPSIEGVYRTLNSPLFPTKGQQQALEFLVASDIFGGDFNMWRLTARSTFAFKVAEIDENRDVALSVRGISILQRPWGETDEIPISQRQFLGSIGTRTALRGFKRRGVGPKADDDPIGGNFYINATAELSYPLQPGFFWVVGFVDAGELVSDYRYFQGDGFSASAGFGVRIQLPLFPTPLGVDFGWPIFDQPGNQRQVVAININVQI